jgi:hypothetical protein
MSSTLDRLLGVDEPIEPTHEIPKPGKNYNDALPHSHMGTLMRRRQELTNRAFAPTDSEGEASSYLSSELDFDWHNQDSNAILRKLSGGGGTEDDE